MNTYTIVNIRKAPVLNTVRINIVDASSPVVQMLADAARRTKENG